jgi:hypothetical protein
MSFMQDRDSTSFGFAVSRSGQALAQRLRRPG